MDGVMSFDYQNFSNWIPLKKLGDTKKVIGNRKESEIKDTNRRRNSFVCFIS